MKVNSIVSNGTIFHTTYSVEKVAMDNTNDTRRMALAMAGLILLFVTSFLTGCAMVETRPAAATGDALTACRMLFQEVDAAIESAGVRDYGSSPVREFPYLRTTRLLASFGGELTAQKHWTAWTTHMAELDAESRALELRNLPATVGWRRNDTLGEELNRCRYPYACRRSQSTRLYFSSTNNYGSGTKKSYPCNQAL